MREITIDNLKPGMKFDAPVYIDERNILVCPASLSETRMSAAQTLGDKACFH